MTRPRDIADSINRINSSAADATAVTIDSSENVGIGLTNPSSYYAENLVVAGADEGGITIESGSTEKTYLMFAKGTSGQDAYRGYIGYDHNVDSLNVVSSGYMNFFSGSSQIERMRILAGGGLTFNGDTAAANALDDYEEGTFNPFSGVSSAYTNETTDNAQYRKIGGVVHIDIRFDWTGTDNSASSASFALPFTASGTTNTANAGSIFYSGTQLKSGASLSPHVGINSSLFSIYRGDGGSFETVRRNEVNGSYEFLISFTYFTND